MFQGGFAAEEMQVGVTFHIPPPPPPPPPPSSVPPSTSSEDEIADLRPKTKAASVLVTGFSPNDDNSLQSFDLSEPIARTAAAVAVGEVRRAAVDAAAAAAQPPPPPMVIGMRLTFVSSFDFYGRITAYQLAVLGREQDEDEGR
eukprot:evm.model.NODE_17657_length_23989_cov_36.963066.2